MSDWKVPAGRGDAKAPAKATTAPKNQTLKKATGKAAAAPKATGGAGRKVKQAAMAVPVKGGVAKPVKAEVKNAKGVPRIQERLVLNPEVKQEVAQEGAAKAVKVVAPKEAAKAGLSKAVKLEAAKEAVKAGSTKKVKQEAKKEAGKAGSAKKVKQEAKKVPVKGGVTKKVKPAAKQKVVGKNLKGKGEAGGQKAAKEEPADVEAAVAALKTEVRSKHCAVASALSTCMRSLATSLFD